MSNLPQFFYRNREYSDETFQEFGTGLVAFEYDIEYEHFKIGDRHVAQENFDPFKYIPELGDKEKQLTPDEMPEHPLMLYPITGPIGSPILHSWVRQNPEQVLEVRELIHKVFVSFYDNDEEIELGEAVGAWGFESHVTEDGGVHLQTLGDCACMGLTPHSHVIEGRLENDFGQYDYHNTDSQAQRVSLLAGLGHIARLASGRPLDQRTLF